ncbi:uncharacterized protein LOC144347246 [Saccoglossus kowalevskii]
MDCRLAIFVVVLFQLTTAAPTDTKVSPVCVIDGDAHRTFDGLNYTFSGKCTYRLIADNRTEPKYFVIAEHKFDSGVGARLTAFTVWVKGRHITGRMSPYNTEPLFTDVSMIQIIPQS